MPVFQKSVRLLNLLASQAGKLDWKTTCVVLAAGSRQLNGDSVINPYLSVLSHLLNVIM